MDIKHDHPEHGVCYICSMHAYIEELEQKCAELRVYAERYQFVLRHATHLKGDWFQYKPGETEEYGKTDEAMDAMIIEAMNTLEESNRQIMEEWLIK